MINWSKFDDDLCHEMIQQLKWISQEPKTSVSVLIHIDHAIYPAKLTPAVIAELSNQPWVLAVRKNYA